jgi:hypothetical protein
MQEQRGLANLAWPHDGYTLPISQELHPPFDLSLAPVKVLRKLDRSSMKVWVFAHK